MQFLDGFELHEHAVAHDVISAECRLDSDSPIGDGDFCLVFELQIVGRELVIKARVVSLFEQPRTEGTMNSHRRVDDPLRDVVDRHNGLDLGVLCVLCGGENRQQERGPS